jgi:hypothetical protein
LKARTAAMSSPDSAGNSVTGMGHLDTCHCQIIV